MKKALITGITGQDGSYLAEFLLGKGYKVHGLHRGDIIDTDRLVVIISDIRPYEIYHLAAQSNARASFDTPEYTAEVTGLNTLRILNAIYKTGLPVKFFQAGSSEMFGKVCETPQCETTPFYPCNPYAVAKIFAHWTTVNYRENYGMFACNGIMFNHESPRRSEDFVSRKITRTVARIKAGERVKLHLGNLDAKRDWGYAQEYVEAMWLMLQKERPDDYVIATGETHTVREFVEVAFDRVDLDWRDHVDVDPKYHRPVEVNQLVGDSSKARKNLGWVAKTSFRNLVYLMVDSDVAAQKENTHGQRVLQEISV